MMRHLACAAFLWASVARGNECWRLGDGTISCTGQGFNLLVSEARFQQGLAEKCAATNARLSAELLAATQRADAAEFQSSVVPVAVAAGVGVLAGVLLAVLAR